MQLAKEQVVPMQELQIDQLKENERELRIDKMVNNPEVLRMI